PNAWAMPVYTSAPSSPPTRNPTFPRKRTHDCPERRREVVELGPAAAQRAPHLYRVHLHSGRDDEALRLPDRDASQRGHRHAVVRVLDRWRHRGRRRGLRAARPLHAPSRLSAVRGDGSGLLPVLRAPRLLAHRQQRSAPRDLLLHLALYLGRRGGAVEPRCQAGEVNPSTAPSSRARSPAPSGCSLGPRCSRISSAGSRASWITRWWAISWGTPATSRSASRSRSSSS